MVSTRQPMPTLRERINHVYAQTGAKGPSGLARWLKIKNPQNITAAAKRGKLSTELADQISVGTGASMEWLVADRGEPFPNGAIPCPGELPTSAEQRLVASEARLEALGGALAAIVKVVSGRTPGAGRELSRTIQAVVGPVGSRQPEIAMAIAAAEEAALLEEQAARTSGPAGSGGKPPRKGR